jgi:hypothetical protein
MSRSEREVPAGSASFDEEFGAGRESQWRVFHVVQSASVLHRKSRLDFGALGLPLVGPWIGVALGKIRLDISTGSLTEAKLPARIHVARQVGTECEVSEELCDFIAEAEARAEGV